MLLYESTTPFISLFSLLISPKSHCLHHCGDQIAYSVSRQRKKRLLENIKDKYPALTIIL